MIKNSIIVLLTLLIITSCGRSEEEVELEKTKIELEKTKLELSEKIEQEEQNKVDEKQAELNEIHEQKVNVGKRKKIADLNLQLQKIPGLIEEAEDKITQLNKFKLGRLPETKKEQLKEARKLLSDLRVYREKIPNEIAQLEYHETFDFQKDPASVMNYIFESSIAGDFSNFRNLGDPYGENDGDVDNICYAEMMTKTQQKEFFKVFVNGRVMGEAQINGDQAVVEFAFGEFSGNRLEQMNMVNRNGYWYLSSY